MIAFLLLLLALFVLSGAWLEIGGSKVKGWKVTCPKCGDVGDGQLAQSEAYRRVEDHAKLGHGRGWVEPYDPRVAP